MIPNAEQLRAISQMPRGDLGEIRFPVLLHALAVHTRTVVLSIERRQLKKEIILENGIPVDCHSNLLQDTLGKFMVARGAINDAQNHDTLSKSATTAKRSPAVKTGGICSTLTFIATKLNPQSAMVTTARAICAGLTDGPCEHESG